MVREVCSSDGADVIGSVRNLATSFNPAIIPTFWPRLDYTAKTVHWLNIQRKAGQTD